MLKDGNKYILKYNSNNAWLISRQNRTNCVASVIRDQYPKSFALWWAYDISSDGPKNILGYLGAVYWIAT